MRGGPLGSLLLSPLLSLLRGGDSSSPAQPPALFPCTLSWGAGPTLLLQNGFVRAELSLTPPVGISDLRGDLAGRGQYGRPALAGPFRLESFGAAPRGAHAPLRPAVAVRANSSEGLWLRLDNVTDSTSPHPVAIERWELRLERGARGLQLTTTGSTLSGRAAAVAHSVGFTASSITAHYGKGVLQARGKGAGMALLSNSSLPRLYALGEGTSVDITRTAAGGTGVTALQSGDAPPMQFGLGRGNPLRRLATRAPPPPPPPPPLPPPGFATVGEGNCVPNLAQWYGTNQTLQQCGAVCASAPPCLGFDFAPGSCRIRFPKNPTLPTPARFSLVSASLCSNITGADGNAAGHATCFRKKVAAESFQCPLPPPPSGFTAVLAGSLGPASSFDTWATPQVRQQLTPLVAVSRIPPPKDSSLRIQTAKSLLAGVGSGGQCEPERAVAHIVGPHAAQQELPGGRAASAPTHGGRERQQRPARRRRRRDAYGHLRKMIVLSRFVCCSSH
eukprot:COSAG04_NODE_1325_length_7211_cov_23.584505_2_plen_503_part_00